MTEHEFNIDLEQIGVDWELVNIALELFRKGKEEAAEVLLFSAIALDAEIEEIEFENVCCPDKKEQCCEASCTPRNNNESNQNEFLELFLAMWEKA